MLPVETGEERERVDMNMQLVGGFLWFKNTEEISG